MIRAPIVRAAALSGLLLAAAVGAQACAGDLTLAFERASARVDGGDDGGRNPFDSGGAGDVDAGDPDGCSFGCSADAGELGGEIDGAFEGGGEVDGGFETDGSFDFDGGSFEGGDV